MPFISAINIYPIKGMRGLSESSGILCASGFENDRRWMLVDQTGTFLSQRSHPILTQFIIEVAKDTITVRYQEKEIHFEINTLSSSELVVSVFDDVMSATEVSPKISEWFSQALGHPVRLVKQSDITNRIKDYSQYLFTDDTLTGTTSVSFADGYPYLILGTASMDLLNSKMKSPLSIDRFRPNIIIQTKTAHEEDNWKEIQIGDQRLLLVKPCARCQVPTIHQKTGMRTKEPNQTLATYRKIANQVFFGMNAVSLTEGLVKIGDPVFTITK